MAKKTASTPLEPGPSTDMPSTSTNNVDRRKRSNSELSVDDLALLASTVIAEWDHNGQHIHRRKMSYTSQECRWLEKYSQLKELHEKHGHAPVTYSNYADKSLVCWVNTQRRCCCIESRMKLLNAIGFVWSPSEALEDLWLEKYYQLKDFYQRYGHAQVTYSNCADNLLVEWAYNQRKRCSTEKRKEMLKLIGFVFPALEGQEDQWLEKYNQLKEFYQKHGHTRVTCSNADKSLVRWVGTQRGCKMEKRRKMLDLIEFVWPSPKSPSKVEKDQC